MKNFLGIVRMTVPTVIEMTSVTLMGVINLIIIGHMGYEAIAAVGVSNVVILNLFALFSGTGYAVKFLVAQRYGAKEYDKCVQFAYTGLYINALLLLPLLAFAFFAPDMIFRLMGTSEAVLSIGVGYLGLRLAAFSLSMFRVVFNGFFRGTGNTKLPMYFGLFGSFVNVTLSLCLVHGYMGLPELGVMGAGWAFVITELLQLTGLLFFFLKKNSLLPTRNLMKFRDGNYKLVSTEGAKIGIEELGMSGAMLVFTIFVARLGDLQLAASEIALNVLSLAYLPGIGLGVTATILIGQHIGKQQWQKARIAGLDVLKVGLVFFLPFTVVYFWGAEMVANLFTQDAAVVQQTKEILRLSAFFLVLDGLQLILAGGLRGAGDNTYTMKAALVMGWGLFIPLSYVLSFTFDLGITGIWLGFYLYILGLFLAFGLRYMKLEWKNVQMKV